MRLTEADLEEGRRLLKNSKGDSSCWDDDAKLMEFLVKHAEALFARREVIAREAVREFAEAVLVQFDKRAMIWEEGATELDGDAAKRCKARAEVMRVDAMNGVRHLAAARGVTLDEKP